MRYKFCFSGADEATTVDRCVKAVIFPPNAAICASLIAVAADAAFEAFGFWIEANPEVNESMRITAAITAGIPSVKISLRTWYLILIVILNFCQRVRGI